MVALVLLAVELGKGLVNTGEKVLSYALRAKDVGFQPLRDDNYVIRIAKGVKGTGGQIAVLCELPFHKGDVLKSGLTELACERVYGGPLTLEKAQALEKGTILLQFLSDAEHNRIDDLVDCIINAHEAGPEQTPHLMEYSYTLTEYLKALKPLQVRVEF